MARTIGIDEEALRRIAAAAEARGVSASEFVMELIAPALRTEGDRASNGAQLKETWTQSGTPGSSLHREDLKRWLGEVGSPACWPRYWAWPRG